MALTSTITESFQSAFGLYRDFVDDIDEEALSSKLLQLPSNTIGQQLWCVVGARESYGRAIKANEWSGFSCSLTGSLVHNKVEVAAALVRSEISVFTVLEDIETFSSAQNRLIINLLEHEIAHQGQLIRYLYGLKLPIPMSWKSKYALV
jgi:hypothetical protein